MSLRNQVILFGVMGMVWLIVLGAVLSMDTGIPAAALLNRMMGYEDYDWFDSSKLSLFGTA